jgi:hypothetical protein
MGFFRGPNIITDGLVLALDAANTKSYPGSGTTAYDLSGNLNSGSLVNGTGFSISNQGAWDFDGTNDYIRVNSISNPVNVSDFSVEAWIKLDVIPTQNPRIVSLGGDASNYFNLATYGGNSPGTYDTFWFEVKKGGNYYGGFHNTGRKYVIDTWYHLLGTFDNSTNTAKLYINGVSVTGGGVGGGAPNVFSTLLIATSTTSPGEVINGLIPVIRYYTKILTASEIQQNFNALKSRFI